jgi:hypothetical protein
MTPPLAQAVSAPPVELDRDDARDAVLAELTDPRYAADDPNLVQRAGRWLFERLGDALDRAVSAVPGGGWGLLLVALVGAAVGAALIIAGRRVLAERRATTAGPGVFAGSARLSAQAHRALADAAAAREDWDTALIEGFRCVVRTLDEQGRWPERPSRTADEAAVELHGLIPALSTDARTTAQRFDEVSFGGRHADASDHRRVLALWTEVSGSASARVARREPVA